ncbi:hypothetical protein Hte_012389 [Hypoxylon texense]
MGLQLQELQGAHDFPAIARLLYESHEDPQQDFFHVFFPIHGAGPTAREESIDEATARLKQWHTEDPSSYWQKVVDTETGVIAGAALWNIYKANPFETSKPMEVTWFPNDSSRAWAEKALEQFSAPHSREAQRPHLCMYLAPLATMALI